MEDKNKEKIILVGPTSYGRNYFYELWQSHLNQQKTDWETKKMVINKDMFFKIWRHNNGCSKFIIAIEEELKKED